MTRARKMYAISNRGIRRCNATILQKLMRAFYGFRNKKEDKLAIVRDNQGYFSIR